LTIHYRAGFAHNMEFFKKPAVQLSILFLLFITAFAVRLHHINKPPHDFAALRQYQAAHIARDYYFKSQDAIPEWRRNVAEVNSKRMGLLLEPRIMENLTVYGYRILGGEHLWIPRVLSSVFWLVGGIFIFLIARKISSLEAAFFSTVFYLFLPFSILASRSFQPDPLMIMMLVFSIFMIIRFYEEPSFLNLTSAAIIAAIAILVKPYSLFFIFGAYLSVGIFKHGIKKALFNIHMLVFAVLSFLPGCLYYIYGILTQVGFLNELAQGSFLPQLIVRPYFWKDWLILIGQVVGYLAFAGALTGLLMSKKGLSKALLSGLWIAYLIFGLIFTLHIHTHDYYHLPLIPVVALSLGPAGVLILNFVYKRWKIVFPAILILILSSGILITQIDIKEFFSKNKNSLKVITNFIGVNNQFKQFITDDFKREVEKGREIGRIVGHSTNTVLLTPNFGRVHPS